MSKLLPPVYNLSGTSPEALLNDASNVVHALVKAVEAMETAYPHGRDYPVSGSYPEARQAYKQRVELARQLLADFNDYAVDIMNMKG